jgi:Tat protein secretion system quality control protein TatD with DNase activity
VTCACGIPERAAAHEWGVDALVAALREKLEKHPNAFVGEIGLDKIRPVSAEWQRVQRELFERQLRLAAELNRAAVIHCVRHYGLLLTILQQFPVESLPEKILLHGYTGSLEITRSLLRLPKGKGRRIYFGVGATTTLRLRDAAAVLAAVPRDKILLESDAHYSMCPRCIRVQLPPPPVEDSVSSFWRGYWHSLAEAVGDSVADTVAENWMRFFR